MAIFIPTIEYTCKDLVDSSLQDCTFRVVDCKLTNARGIFADCDNIWNDNLCQTDHCYNTPVPFNSKFILQTQFVDFYHADPYNPTDGWGTWITIELFNADGTSISSTLADFASRWGVGLAGKTSIQMIEIDTGLASFIGLNSFYFKIQTLDETLSVVDELCTQHFSFLGPCERVIKLSSRYPGFDCFNNYYGELDNWISPNDPFEFDNSFYLRASLLEGEDQVSKESYNGRVSKADLVEAFDVILEKMIPYWEKNRLSKMWAPGAEVYVDGEQYQLDNLTIDNRLTTQAGRMFLFTVGLTRECKLNYQCVTLDVPTGGILVPPIVVEQCIECIDVSCVGP